MALYRSLGALALPAVLLSACVSDRVDFGGVMNPVEPPSNAVSCDFDDWELTSKVAPAYPPELWTFLYMQQTPTDVRALNYRYDINAAGEPVNIRFVSPEHYLDHGATQSAILAGAEALDQWRFTPLGEARYSTGCPVGISFELR